MPSFGCSLRISEIVRDQSKSIEFGGCANIDVFYRGASGPLFCIRFVSLLLLPNWALLSRRVSPSDLSKVAVGAATRFG